MSWVQVLGSWAGFRATRYQFRFPRVFHVPGSGVGFTIPVSGSAGKCLRIPHLVSCPGFRIEISRFPFEGHSRAFLDIGHTLVFRGLFRVSCLRIRV